MKKEKVYEIGQAYIRLDINAKDTFKREFEKYLLYKGKKYAKEFYNKDLLLDQLYFSIELEDGSLKARLKIYGKMTLQVLIAYGGIRSGIDYMIKDTQKIVENIARDVANEPNIGYNKISRVERRLGVPGKIKRLYNEIEKLKKERNNLTENEQNEIINKIHDQLNELITVLDNAEIQVLEQDINGLTNYNGNSIAENDTNSNYIATYHPQYAIREDDITLISEDDIEPPTLNLPPY